MAAAFSAFVNDGIYTEPRTFSRVELNDGTLLIDNVSESHAAMKESTAYLMRDMLETVVASGTGTEADFSGQYVCGKTGTTDANRDRYFVGFTPYYCAAVWTGYKSNEEIDISGNPSAALWRSVMKKIHKDLERGEFSDGSGLKRVTVCKDSGLLATDACTHDLRGNRTHTVTVAADTAPKDSCTMHKMVKYCSEGKHIATEFCPEETVKEMALLDYERELINKNGNAIKEDDTEQKNVVKAKDHKYLLQTASLGELCPKHKEAPKPPEPVLPDLPDFPDLPDIPGFGDGEPDNGGTPDGGGNPDGGESSGETQPAARTGLRRLVDWIF
jgi:penicillin-binding protein 1A